MILGGRELKVVLSFLGLVFPLPRRLPGLSNTQQALL